MEVLHSANLLSLLDTLLCLSTAFVLGGLIGFERQYRHRTAGLRTNVLVAVGAAAFVHLAYRVNGQVGAVRVIAYVVSGIGFLGAGVIMRESGNVRGLNTAATLWGSGAVGATAGANLIAEAALATAFVLTANTLLRPVVNVINRKLMDVKCAAGTIIIRIIAKRIHQKKIMEHLEEELERSTYPMCNLQIHTVGQEEVEIRATLVATPVDGDNLDALVQRLAALPAVRQAFWTPSASE